MISKMQKQKESLLQLQSLKNAFQTRFGRISNLISNKGDRILKS